MENKIKFNTITTPPTASDLKGLFKEARILAGFTSHDAGKLAASFDSRYKFNDPNYQQWERGSKPGPNFKKALLSLFKGICNQSVYQDWVEAYEQFEKELDFIRAEKKHQSKLDAFKDNPSIENKSVNDFEELKEYFKEFFESYLEQVLSQNSSESADNIQNNHFDNSHNTTKNYHDNSIDMSGSTFQGDINFNRN